MTYLSQPALSLSHLYFITEEDLWCVPLSNPSALASRLTAGQGPVSKPKVSPDGKWIAIASEEEGHSEIYLMPSMGGELKRITYFGAWSTPLGWKDQDTLIFKSNAKHPHGMQEFFRASINEGTQEALRLGEGTSLDYSTSGIVIERNMHRPDPSHWKRYRGGTMGRLWVARNENESFRKLDHLEGNLSSPLWLGNRIFYLSDETGLGRLYSCDSLGEKKRIHGGDFYSEYYFRNLTTNGDVFAFQSAGDLYLYDPKRDKIEALKISVPSEHVQSKRKSVSLSTNYSDYSLQPQGERILLEGRGKVISFAHWSGPVSVLGTEKGIRYKSADWLPDGKRVVLVADDGLVESIEVYTDQGTRLKKVEGHLHSEGFGRISQIKTSPKTDELAFLNHRNELFFVDLLNEKIELIHKDLHQIPNDFDWSPDGRYLAFQQAQSPNHTQIAVWQKETKQTHLVTEGKFQDYAPHFDPTGKYLYFLSKRVFNPIYDELIFDMTFPKAAIPLLIVLKKNEPSPFIRESTLPDALLKTPRDAQDPASVRCEIDFEGIQDRIVQFPVNEAKYTRIIGLGNKVLWSYLPVEGTLNIDLSSGSVPPAKEYLDCFDFGTGKFEYFGTGVTNFKVRHACGLRMVRQGNSLRIFKAVEKAEELGIKDIADSKSGLIDLSRANIMVEPKIEWRQMFRDAWRMQKEFFWSKDLLGIDWDAVYKRYEPLIEKVNCRREFSDVIWELVGELGTSHAYERGGDYRINPAYPLGALGADMVWDEKEKGYEISRIFRGDPWSKDHASPLIAPGIQLKAGDFLTEIAGVSLSKFRSPAEAVLNRSGQDVWIRYRARGESDTKTGIIRLLKNEQPLRYRAWVNEKRARVKELSQERLGYVHIPNMMGLGFAEFHRGFLQEVSCEGLVIDVRYNGGGHVSQLILDRLARRPLGKSVSRWTGSQSVPYETPRKATVAICNEFAGSDGDIFSHTFKMRKIGKLIGTRTWGGVVGIWPRYSMIDGGLTTQPEFSTWFEDLGYGLENHGAEPDLVVEFPPEAWRLGQDPQLEAAVNEALKSL